MAVLQPSQEFGSIARKVWPWSMTRGVLAVIFGILGFALIMPTGSLGLFALIIGIFAILDGLTHIGDAVERRHASMVLRVIAGAVGVVYGVLALVMMTGQSMTNLIWMTAIWAFVIGGLEVVSDLMERGVGHRDWVWGIVMGGLAVAFAVVAVIWMPALSMLTLCIATATILWGVSAGLMGSSERSVSRTG